MEWIKKQEIALEKLNKTQVKGWGQGCRELATF